MNFFSANRPLIVSRLTVSTLLYLALPNFLFLFCWLRQPLNFFASGLLFLVLVALLIRAFRPFSPQVQLDSELNSSSDFWLQVGYTLLPLLIFSFVSGVGGFGVQLSDWEKHNSMLRDLMVHSWPVRYESGESLNSTLIYYFAYYLPSALVGKVWGWDAANCALLVWSILGFLLLSIWLTVFIGKKLWWLGLAFLLLNNYDFIGFHIDNFLTWIRIRYAIGMSGDFLNHMRIVWRWEFAPDSGSWVSSINGISLGYTSVITSFLFGPQHSLPAWLGGAILLRGQFFSVSTNSGVSNLNQRDNLETAIDLLTVTLIILWSAFIFLGCLPLLAIKVFYDRKQLGSATIKNSLYKFGGSWLLPLIYICIAFTFGILLLFFSGKQSDGRFGFSFALPAMLAGNIAFQLFKYAVFMLGSWVLPALLIRKCFKVFPHATGELKSYLWLSVVLLLVIPCVGYGMNNDFAMRVSMPIVFTLRLLILYFAVLIFSVENKQSLLLSHRRKKLAFLAMGVCGVLSLSVYMLHNLQKWQNRPDFNSVPSMTKLYEREEFKGYKANLYAQYLGSLNKNIFR